MIGRIRGIILEKQPPHLLLDVNGIGYEIEAPMTTFYSLPEIGKEIHIYTHLAIRDDAHLLFGFASENERRLFRTLLKVNGVGAKMALTILSGIESNDFALCIQQGDTERLVRLPGVGKKTAERMILELKEAAAKFLFEHNHEPDEAVPGPEEDLISALENLGYRKGDAEKAADGACQEAAEGTPFAELLRLSLKKLSRA